MRRFSNLFVYESTTFDGVYRDCKLLEDIYHTNTKHVYALTGEMFPVIIVNIDTSEIHFYEEFDLDVPIFTLHFKLQYV